MKYAFLPTYIENNIFKINFKHYYDLGFRYIIFDIDNTLVLHEQIATDNAKNLIKELYNFNFDISILSNNKQNRVEQFCKDVNISKFIYNANKPNVTNYLKIVYDYNHNIEETLFIGDQIFTDIYGANKSNIKNILVKPIGKEIYFHIKIKRVLEKVILLYYKYILKII